MNDSFPLSELPLQSTIHVWKIELDRPLRLGVNFDPILSVEEHSRAERFVFAKDAARFRVCRAMLRLGLGWYLKMPPSEIALIAGLHGKPYLAEPSELHFNVTHSGGLALIAFTTAGEVGIDIEELQRDVEAVEIASAYFTENEAAMIVAAETPHEQAATFLRFWTRKEAVLKAAGYGIQLGLDTVDVSQQAENLVRLSGARKEIAESLWLVRDIEPIDGFAGAVAAPAGDWAVRRWPIRPEDAIDRLATRFPRL